MMLFVKTVVDEPVTLNILISPSCKPESIKMTD